MIVFANELIDTEYFSVPLTVTRRKLDGLRDSLVQSSVWRPNFKKSLDSYPHLEIVQLDFAVPACDACHLGGRLSTRLGRVSGSKYDRVGFEHVSSIFSRFGIAYLRLRSKLGNATRRTKRNST